MYNTIVINSSLNRRQQFTGTLGMMDIVTLLQSETLGVSEQAQRSIHKKGKFIHDQTSDFLKDPKNLEYADRLKSLEAFIDHCVLKPIRDETDPESGFPGTIQLTIPEESNGFVEFKELQGFNDIGTQLLEDQSIKIGYLDVKSRGIRVYLLIDGQARVLVLLMIKELLKSKLEKLRGQKRNLINRGQDCSAVDEKIEKAEAYQKFFNKYLSENFISFNLTAKKIEDDGKIVGLSLREQQNSYVEANSMNSKSDLTESMLFDNTREVFLLQDEMKSLYEDSLPLHPWLLDDCIQLSKTIPRNSDKLFTLSAVSQALCLSAYNIPNAFKNKYSDEKKLLLRKEFLKEYWKLISKTFSNHWCSYLGEDKERRQYIREKRFEERNICFQAIFLQGLGKLGYTLGNTFDWNPEKLKDVRFDLLSPSLVPEYALAKDDVWLDPDKNKLIDQVTAVNKDGNRSFQNVSNSIRNVSEFLFGKLELQVELKGTGSTTPIEEV